MLGVLRQAKARYSVMLGVLRLDWIFCDVGCSRDRLDIL